MRRKVKSLLSNHFEPRGDAKEIVKMTSTLPLLPEDKILEGFNSVQSQEYVKDHDVSYRLWTWL